MLTQKHYIHRYQINGNKAYIKKMEKKTLEYLGKYIKRSGDRPAYGLAAYTSPHSKKVNKLTVTTFFVLQVFL